MAALVLVVVHRTGWANFLLPTVHSTRKPYSRKSKDRPSEDGQDPTDRHHRMRPDIDDREAA
ncbi:MAG: hypothetical protein R2849_06890 [Thermomicrobiales bacterium]